jgi:hypothetical protein
MGRVEELAQSASAQSQAVHDAMAYQAQLMQQVLALQQQVADLTQQHVDGSTARMEEAGPNGNTEEYLKYILQRVDASANAAAAQVDLLQQQLSRLEDLEAQIAAVQGSSAPAQAQFGEMIALLEEIREHIGDLASGVPPSQGGFLDRSQEEFVQSIYTKLEQGKGGQESQVGRAPLRATPPYSKVEETPAGPLHGFARENLQAGPSASTQVGTAAARVPSNTPIDTLFAEEESYLAERKAYLDERKDYLERKKAWQLG